MKNKIHSYSIGICDDEAYWLTNIKDLCEKLCFEHDTSIKYYTFLSGTELIDYSNHLDILFLDEEMQGITGQMVKELYERYNKNTMIVFVTNHAEIIYDSFGKNVYGFLTKPIDVKLFRKIFKKLILKLESNNFISVYDSSEHINILCENILYIEAQGSYSIINYNTNNKILVRKSLSELEGEITYKHLIRIHKSYIANLEHIQKISTKYASLLMCDGKDLPISRRRKNIVEEHCIFFTKEQANSIWNI